MRNSFLLALLLSSLPVCAADPAASTNQAPMIDIQAKSATYQFKTGTATFSGGVTVNDPDVVMKCRTLVATFTTKQKAPDDAGTSQTVRLKSGENIDKIEALGNVVIESVSTEHKGTIGRSERAIYTAADRKIVMVGNRPNIKQPNGRETTADTITYDVANGTVDAEGNVVVSFARPAADLFNTTTQPPK